MPPNSTRLIRGLASKCEVEDEVARLMCGQPERSAGQELHHVCRAVRLRLRFDARAPALAPAARARASTSPAIIHLLSRVAPLLQPDELGICGLAEGPTRPHRGRHRMKG